MGKIICFHSDEAVEYMQGVAPNPISGHPVTHVWRCFVHPSGNLVAGIWACEAGAFEIMSHPSTEVCTILEGTAIIEHEDGSRVAVAPGDSFVIPYGAHTVWRVEEYIKKSFVCNFMGSNGSAA